jgi:ribonuclease HI
MSKKKPTIEAWFDGCCEPKNPGGHASYGAVVIVNGVRVLEESGYCGVGQGMSNNVAEYAGCIAVLKCIEKHQGTAIVRGDSMLVVKQLNRQWGAHGGAYIPYYREAMEIWMKLKRRARIDWIPREQNSICDVLSKKVLKDMGVRFVLQPED